VRVYAITDGEETQLFVAERVGRALSMWRSMHMASEADQGMEPDQIQCCGRCTVDWGDALAQQADPSCKEPKP
jgi:hypothetical protein